MFASFGISEEKEAKSKEWQSIVFKKGELNALLSESTNVDEISRLKSEIANLEKQADELAQNNDLGGEGIAIGDIPQLTEDSIGKLLIPELINCRIQVDNLGQLTYDDDVAVAFCGNSCVMPSCDNFQELIDNCDYKITVIEGVEGYMFKSKKNQKECFFPAANAMWAVGSIAGTGGYYWTSSLHTTSPDNALSFNFNSNNISIDNFYRCHGFPVRAVMPKN